MLYALYITKRETTYQRKKRDTYWNRTKVHFCTATKSKSPQQLKADILIYVYLFLAWREQSLNTGNAFNVQFMTKTGFILQLFHVAIRLDRGHVYRCVANDRINIVMTFWVCGFWNVTTYYYKFQKFNWNAIHLHRLFTANTCLAFVWFLSQFLLSFGINRKSFDFSTIFLYLSTTLV